jgi:hypothetical protein
LSQYSAHPEEKEILIFPATIFKIIKTEYKPNNSKYYISLKIIPSKDLKD